VVAVDHVVDGGEGGWSTLPAEADDREAVVFEELAVLGWDHLLSPWFRSYQGMLADVSWVSDGRSAAEFTWRGGV
jgi:hypothetical protein